MTHKEALLRLYSRTYNNCLFYKRDGDDYKLLNEIGVLRGISYCIEAIVGEGNLFCEIDFSMFKEMIDEQQRLKEARPRIIVEVDGGMVQRVLSDRKVDVDVLDMDNYNISEDEEEISAYEDMICEASLLQKVW